MSAFINGALVALNRVYALCESLDPFNENIDIQNVKKQIEGYRALYLEMDKLRFSTPQNYSIESLEAFSEEDLIESVKKTIFDA